MGYALKDEQETWPTKQSLSDFTRSSCTPVTKLMIHDYFDELWPRFRELEQRVNDVVGSAQEELEQLTDKLNEYQTSLVIGDDFVRYVVI